MAAMALTSSATIARVPKCAELHVPHRYGALKENWVKIITPVVKQLNMQIRYNLKTRNIEIRSPDENCNNANIQKAADFVRICLGFNVDDAVA
uniref:Uncharacterized protein n=1 Tax=Ditylenchus dipsaci TaxID=166011 RepID=A0A915ERU2_9BILA